MNERIQALAEQCCEPRQYGPSWFNSKKFAELIVKECADVCEEYRGTKWGKAAECIGDSIREHFGVK